MGQWGSRAVWRGPRGTLAPTTIRFGASTGGSRSGAQTNINPDSIRNALGVSTDTLNAGRRFEGCVSEVSAQAAQSIEHDAAGVATGHAELDGDARRWELVEVAQGDRAALTLGQVVQGSAEKRDGVGV